MMSPKKLSKAILHSLIVSFLLFSLSQSGVVPINELDSRNTISGIANPMTTYSPAASCILSYTSRWDDSPNPLSSGATAIGDHVKVQAHIVQNPLDVDDIERTRIEISYGSRFESTQPLVISGMAPSLQFEADPINASEFAWVVVKGLNQGDMVRVVCNFTNEDCDFMAWPGEVAPESWNYANNIFNGDMASGAKPEVSMLTWPSSNDTMFLACLDYMETPGNFTVVVDNSQEVLNESPGNSVFVDTYYLLQNLTANIQVWGYSAFGNVHYFEASNIAVHNFFAPLVYVQPPEEIADSIWQVNWTSTDLNSDDMHLYDVYLCAGAGYCQLAARNLTQSTFTLDLRGFLENEYWFKILSHSADLTTRVEIEPGVFWPDITLDSSDCWPGDTGIGYSVPFPAGDSFPPPPKGDIEVATAEDITYEVGTSGHYISWDVLGDWLYSFDPFQYSIYVDGEFVENGTQYGHSTDIVFNVDGLQVGVHEVELMYNNSGPRGGIYSDVVIVRVINIDSGPRPSELLILVGVLPGIIAIIILRKYAILGEKESSK